MTVKDRYLLIADGSRARVLATDRSMAEVEELSDHAHAQTRQPDRDVRTDAPGRYSQSPGALPGSFVEERDLHAEERRNFARELAAVLARAVDDHRLGELVLVAPPQMLGHLRSELPDRVTSRIVATVDKDYAQLPVRDALEHVRQALAG